MKQHPSDEQPNKKAYKKFDENEAPQQQLYRHLPPELIYLTYAETTQVFKMSKRTLGRMIKLQSVVPCYLTEKKPLINMQDMINYLNRGR